MPHEGDVVDNFGREFNWWPRAWNDRGNSAAQAIGSYHNGTATISNGVITYTIENPMTLRSLFFGTWLDHHGLGQYAFPPVHSGPMSYMNMTIQWRVRNE